MYDTASFIDKTNKKVYCPIEREYTFPRLSFFKTFAFRHIVDVSDGKMLPDTDSFAVGFANRATAENLLVVLIQEEVFFHSELDIDRRIVVLGVETVAQRGIGNFDGVFHASLAVIVLAFKFAAFDF